MRTRTIEEPRGDEWAAERIKLFSRCNGHDLRSLPCGAHFWKRFRRAPCPLGIASGKMFPLMNDRRPHPHFDDRGTLAWETRYEDALARAKREKKIVFIEMGREL